MNLTSKNSLNFNPQFGENPFEYYCPQLQMCDKHSITNYSGAEFQSFKKPRISEPMMSVSSTLRSKQARPMNAKSQPCLQYKRGLCKYGANCIFSHDETGEARKFVPYSNRGSILAENQHTMMTSRVKLCWFFVNGENCPYGNRCHFLHQSVKNGKGGLRVAREKTAVTVVSTGVGEGYRKECDELNCKRFENLNSDTIQIQQKLVLWKTKLCHKWERNGSCPYGVKCLYAHGERELRKFESFCPLEYGKSFVVEDLAVDTEDAASTKAAISTFRKQQEKNKKWFVKWDKVEKICGIYADWIEKLHKVGSFRPLESGELLEVENLAGNTEDAGMKEIRSFHTQQKR